jgi:hypothetical protein
LHGVRRWVIRPGPSVKRYGDALCKTFKVPSGTYVITYKSRVYLGNVSTSKQLELLTWTLKSCWTVSGCLSLYRSPDTCTSDLPKSDGLLATWQLIVATMAVFNTIQNFATLKLTRRLYTGVPSSSSKTQSFIITGTK